MNRGDIYSLSLDPVSGREQQGTRPVLIVSSSEFNKAAGVVMVVPITNGGNFARQAGFSVSLSGAGTATTGIVRCDQLRTVDLRARNGRRIEAVPDYIVQDVLGRLETILG